MLNKLQIDPQRIFSLNFNGFSGRLIQNLFCDSFSGPLNYFKEFFLRADTPAIKDSQKYGPEPQI